jgi:5'-3' exonuclease
VVVTSKAPNVYHMPRTPIVLAVDGNSLAVRALHAYEHTRVTDSRGRDISTVFGFFSLLIGICQKTRPDAVVVGFDDQRTSLRRIKYPDYKAQRGGQSSQLTRHIADIYLALADLGIVTVIPPGLEADDVVASAAYSATQSGWLCVIATSDRDAFSSISSTTTVLRLTSGLANAQRMTPALLKEQFGVAPHHYLGFAALRGDVSDNLPGVHGIGPKTAAKVMTTLGDVTRVLSEPHVLNEHFTKATQAKLTTPTARSVLARNLDLMAPHNTLDLPPHDHRLRVSHHAVHRTFAALELPSLAPRAIDAFCPVESTPAPVQHTGPHSHA